MGDDEGEERVDRRCIDRDRHHRYDRQGQQARAMPWVLGLGVRSERPQRTSRVAPYWHAHARVGDVRVHWVLLLREKDRPATLAAALARTAA